MVLLGVRLSFLLVMLSRPGTTRCHDRLSSYDASEIRAKRRRGRLEGVNYMYVYKSRCLLQVSILPNYLTQHLVHDDLTTTSN